ncbi:hypothetical protein GP486_008565, partial [Trichoglossum hirsutum]
MAGFDFELGRAVQAHLEELGIETPMTMGRGRTADSQAVIEYNVGNIMVKLGLDMNDDSLLQTPMRVSKMFCHEIFTGLDYSTFPKMTVIENKMGYDEMVMIKAEVK